MPRKILILVTLALSFSYPALTQNPVDFTGTWKSDPARSESAHQDTPIGPITLEIQQTSGGISIETRTNAKDRPVVANETLMYHLDGTENTLPGANGVEVICKARWKGQTLVAETVRNLNDATVTTHWELSLNANGKELQLHKTLSVQHGYQALGPANNVGSGTDIFVKVASAARKLN